jgi:hypothetical protein
VFGSGNKLLNHIWASGETSPIHGYLINSYQFQTSEVMSSFWKLQLLIIAQLRRIRLLSVVVAVVIRDHDRRSVTAFVRGLLAAHWKVELMDIAYMKLATLLLTPAPSLLPSTHPVQVLSSQSISRCLHARLQDQLVHSFGNQLTGQSTCCVLVGMTRSSIRRAKK